MVELQATATNVAKRFTWIAAGCLAIPVIFTIVIMTTPLLAMLAFSGGDVGLQKAALFLALAMPIIASFIFSAKALRAWKYDPSPQWGLMRGIIIVIAISGAMFIIPLLVMGYFFL